MTSAHPQRLGPARPGPGLSGPGRTSRLSRNNCCGGRELRAGAVRLLWGVSTAASWEVRGATLAPASAATSWVPPAWHEHNLVDCGWSPGQEQSVSRVSVIIIKENKWAQCGHSEPDDSGLWCLRAFLLVPRAPAWPSPPRFSPGRSLVSEVSSRHPRLQDAPCLFRVIKSIFGEKILLEYTQDISSSAHASLK